MTWRSTINGQSGEGFVARALDRIGPMQEAEKPPAQLIAHHAAPTPRRLPDLLLDLWEHHGIGDLAGGRLRLCPPGALQREVDMLLRGDPYLAGDTQAIAFGAFGDLLLWSARFQMVYVTMQLSIVEVPQLIRPEPGLSDDAALLRGLLDIHPDAMDARDLAGQPMFERARAQLKPLPPLHIYGMQPPAPIDEPFTLDHHAVSDFPLWLEEKVASTIFTLADPETGRMALRDIGPLQPGEPLRPAGDWG